LFTHKLASGLEAGSLRSGSDNKNNRIIVSDNLNIIIYEKQINHILLISAAKRTFLDNLIKYSSFDKNIVVHPVFLYVF